MLDNFLNQNKTIFSSLNTIFPTSITGSQLDLQIPSLPARNYEWDKKMGYADDVISKAKNARTEYPLPQYEYKFFNPGFGVTNPTDPPIDPDISAFLEEYKKVQKQKLYSSIANQVGNWADVGSAQLSKDMVYGSGTQKLFNGLDALEKIPGIGTGIKVFNFGRDAATYAWSSKVNEFDYDPTLSANLGSSYNFKKFDELKEMNGKRAIGSKLNRLNNERNEAKLQIDLLSGINSENQARSAMRDNVGFNQLNYNTKLNGGNNLTYIGKKGLKFELIKRAKNIKSHINTKKIEEFENGGKFEPEIINIKPEIITNKNSVTKFQNGGKTDEFPIEYINFIDSVKQHAPNLGDLKPKGYNMFRYWELHGKPLNWEQALNKNMFFKADDGQYHAPSVAWNEKGEGEWMKHKTFPTAWMEKAFYDGYEVVTDEKGNPLMFDNQPEYEGVHPVLRLLVGDDAKESENLRYNYDIVDDGHGNLKYVPKKQKNNKYKDVYDFYNDYDLSNINIIEGNEAKTEGNNIYITNDEDLIHELHHYTSQNKPNEIYKEFYDNLNDQRIQELGGDLQFVNRTGDPNEFYNPSELEARIKAAKYKTQGQNYTKDFFRELRNNPEKYGYNMRDLLYMYNDENLEKIFNLKQGGTIKESDELVKLEETTQKNVIPEGALHKNKHHMEHAEGLTQKGIPVIDDDGEQQAEIELNEIIFTLEVTKKLEELHKIFKEGTNKEKDEAAIEAGKLLVQEILYNTDDRTGLISKCQKGGKLNEFK